MNTTVVARKGKKQESVSQNRVVEAPPVAELIKKEVLLDKEVKSITERAADQATVEGRSAPTGKQYVIDREVDRS